MQQQKFLSHSSLFNLRKLILTFQMLRVKMNHKMTFTVNSLSRSNFLADSSLLNILSILCSWRHEGWTGTLRS